MMNYDNHYDYDNQWSLVMMIRYMMNSNIKTMSNVYDGSDHVSTKIWRLLPPILEDYAQDDFNTNSVEDGWDDSDALVRGEYRNLVNSTGWGFIEISSNPAYTDKEQVATRDYK